MTASAPRGLRRLPFVGHAPAFLRDKLGFLQRCARELGDVAELALGGRTVLLGHPGDVRHVLVSQQTRYGKSPRITGAGARRLLGSSVLTTEGAEHRAQRRLLQSLLGSRMVASLMRTVPRRTSELLAEWRDGDTVDLGEAMHRLVRRCTLEMIFGEHLTQACPEIEAIVETRRTYVDGALSSPLPRLEAWPTPRRHLFLRSRARLTAIVAEAIERGPERRGEDEGLLELLATAMRESAASPAAEEIAEQLAAVAVAGYETPRHLLAWTGDQLARHLALQERVQRELDELLAGVRQPGDLERLAFTSCVVSETLRLYPPTWLIVRVAVENDVLPSGAAIGAGTKVYVSPYVLHRDPRWFADPERFEPERFAAGKTRPAAYLPFGAGPRQCLGETLARTEAVLVLAAILSGWRLEPSSDRPVRPAARIALEPATAIRVRVRRRPG